MKISIIIPTLNEAGQIVSCLQRLCQLRDVGHEVIVVDGGSDDSTVQLAKPLCDQLVNSLPSRSLQMNSGARYATGDYLLFLHADTFLPENITPLFNVCTADTYIWGRFDIQLTGKNWLFRIIESCMNLRSRVTGIATGDQGIFINKNLYEKVGGFPELELMEDIAISKCLNKVTKPVCLDIKVKSSSRRWEENGIIRTILKMWWLRILYFFDYDTGRLAKYYK